MKKIQSTNLIASTSQSQRRLQAQPVKHGWHFVLTLLTLGLWGIVWWWLTLRAEGKPLFSGFDDAYWSYLMERDQPPAALHPMHFSKNNKNSKFDA
ncbi:MULTISPECIES: hypothetical protein [unclassified Shewanella]|uniref:hypothetical protein n=1 Tax=unclassified Shewanella TaxID=196818 RepID=UPI001BC0D59C|nr:MULTISPECIES: hypothetical protein [unclassified Shewanella]GIU07160.1 hypothetical protein TUM4444_06230 [Shewanella sp. MBTL60-112-B1]GIU35538.1 hypothetical protein TUM4445_25470 [Shewanella sp. MBTL60-112-B2]